MSIILVEDVTFSYNEDKQGLNDISFSVEKGEWIAILGHNGSGKSTLAKTLVGLLEPQKGRILIEDTPLSEETAFELRKKVGIVFQNPDNQFVGVTVKDDIAFGLENLCVEREEMLRRIDFYSDKVDMKKYLNKQPSNLSGGQKQRVAIAGILAMRPDILIFDEATSMLDPYTKNDIVDYIKLLSKEGFTVIMITHDVNEAILADKIMIMNKGKISAFDKTENILKQRDLFIENHLELPVALEIGFNIKNEEMRDKLWAYVLKK